ncbi:MAG: SufS family cysteine desulfurase [Roseivirga sp.]|nr:SufS family cysteine desulfurase [Roseivirga sp.]
MNVEAVKKQFPIFNKANPAGNELIYLDNAATTQKPQVVIDAIADYYAGYNSNVGRGSYWPATAATIAFKEARNTVQDFINARTHKECIFTSGTTDAINKVANNYLIPNLTSADSVIVTEMEHHGNFVPWQQACLSSGAKLKVIPLRDNGDLDYEAYEQLLDDSVRMVAVTAISNALGTKNDLKRIVEAARAFNTAVLIDAAQLVTHEKIDVQQLDCDFLVFSGHKLFGPTGIGVLYGKEDLLEGIPPLSYGGGMVKQVTVEETIFADLPEKHEGGTSNIAGVIGLGAAICFVNKLGLTAIHEHTKSLTDYTLVKLGDLDGVRILGLPDERASVISLAVEKVHPHDVASFLSERGIAIRAGHHCTHPLMKRLGVQGTCRVSFGIYNKPEEVDMLIEGLIEVRDFFA